MTTRTKGAVVPGVSTSQALTAGDSGLSVVLETPHDRVRAAKQLQRIAHHIATAPSATLTLEQWMTIEHCRSDVQVRSELLPGLPTPLTPDQRLSLGISAEESTGYRHVLLLCGDTVLCEARNWYRPEMLDDVMRAQLNDNRTSFGRVILPLGPQRQTVTTAHLWEDVFASAPDGPLVLWHGDVAFVHEARVLDQSGRVLALVEERYRYALLCLDPEE